MAGEAAVAASSAGAAGGGHVWELLATLAATLSSSFASWRAGKVSCSGDGDEGDGGSLRFPLYFGAQLFNEVIKFAPTLIRYVLYLELYSMFSLTWMWMPELSLLRPGEHLFLFVCVCVCCVENFIALTFVVI